MQKISVPPKFNWTSKERYLWIACILVGIGTFIYGLKTDPQRIWANYLLEYFYWLCLALAGLFFVALHFLTGAYWSNTVRRVAGTFSGYLPIALVLFVGLLFGLHHLFEWTHHPMMETDPLLAGKKAYLNVPFFIIRHLLLFALCFILGRWIFKNSTKQDETGDVTLTKKNRRLSAPFIFLFAWAFSFAAIDLMMSLSPHWFSTIFGVYCWAGLFYSGLAMITLWAIFLKRRGPLKGYFNENHLHDLGKFMFAFTVFWGYIGFSQYMLIWYGNLPEETFYFIDRMKGNWKFISIALMIGKFGVPFLLLIGRHLKRNENFMLLMCFWFLAAQWLDIYWMVFPTFYQEGPVFGWMEVGMFVGFAGLFFLSVGRALSQVNVIPIKDPFLEDCLHHHQTENAY